MKKTILLFTLLCATLAGRAQGSDYRPMMGEDRVRKSMFEGERVRWYYAVGWNPEQINSDGIDVHATTLEHGIADGEMEIDGKVYKRLYTNRIDFAVRKPGIDAKGEFYARQANGVENDKEEYLGVREENGRVYVNYKQYCDYMKRVDLWATEIGYPHYTEEMPYYITDEGEMILYDFNLQVGEGLNPAASQNSVTVETIEEMTDDQGVNRKLFTFSNGCQVVEGIGCISRNRLLLSYLNTPEELANYTGTQYLGFFAYSVNRETVLKHSFDLPQGISDCIIDSHHAPAFDLQGRRLAAPPAKGVYIQGGRLKIGHGLIR